MSRLFITVLNMSLTASYVALVVIFIRMILGKFPKIFSYVLWAAVWFRLLCPVSFKSPLSLVPIKSPIPYDIATVINPTVGFGIESIDSVINQPIKSSVSLANPAAGLNHMGIIMEIATAVWLLGIAVILCYSILSYFRLKARHSTATIYKDNIYETDRIKTPFVLGFIRPKIFIPTGLAQNELDYIIKHEQVHIKRKDHIIKPLAFLAVVLHWFNPLIWFCYFLMSKDMEMSCDESVIRQSKEDIRASYSNSLLSLSVKQSGFLMPLTFGESNVKSRIKNVLNYKKPVFWIVLTAVVLVVVMSLALMANPLDGAGFLNTHGKAFSISFYNPFNRDRDVITAEKFLKYKTDYTGDASKVGNIIYLLDFPEKVKYDHFELSTDSIPYAITVHLTTDTQTRNYFTGALHQAPFKKNAIIMFSLIGNVDYINFNLNDGKNEYLMQYLRDEADMTVGKDVRDFSKGKLEFTQLLKILNGMGEDSSISTVGGADGPLKVNTSIKTSYGSNWSDQIIGFAWEKINRDIAHYEENPEVKIIDSKITRLELLESFDTLADVPIDVYALEYRLLPEDLSKVVLAGGMDVDENGWLKETSSMGSPLLVVSRNNGSAEFLGTLWTGEVSGKNLETEVKTLLERKQ